MHLIQVHIENLVFISTSPQCFKAWHRISDLKKAGWMKFRWTATRSGYYMLAIWWPLHKSWGCHSPRLLADLMKWQGCPVTTCKQRQVDSSHRVFMVLLGFWDNFRAAPSVIRVAFTLIRLEPRACQFWKIRSRRPD